MNKTSEALFESQVEKLPLVSRGKVRDIYGVDDDKLLIVASDRLSAFDVVLPTPIPGKGWVLTALSNFWFGRTQHIVSNHLIADAHQIVLPEMAAQTLRDGRAMIVRKLKPLPIEAIVRGYLIGSGWKDYQATGAVCGIELPAGLLQADKLPEPIFTPSTKADVGDHDDNISFDRAAELISLELAERVKQISLQLYIEAAEHALGRGIIIADTKFEFGLDDDGTLILIDEVLTPDSSRFWPADTYTPGSSPPSFDKQYVRDYLETLDWNKKAPGPVLPPDVVARTSEKYYEAFKRLTTTS
ncbi:MAG: phosphoribosylaminoimidazolesuccinocarboxamide synthase [Gammaproteobacteria bacterium]|nr:phosphoribosylaminoimidazolesuccinocarboxamide synthase [Pseudomonadota bacterium]MCZ6733749.1 phosphoribosylaminoimidazolesuccinocarboxamide synthase [Gammaproteobacteria bacterium]